MVRAYTATVFVSQYPLYDLKRPFMFPIRRFWQMTLLELPVTLLQPCAEWFSEQNDFLDAIASRPSTPM
jgi:hypothetical protein